MSRRRITVLLAGGGAVLLLLVLQAAVANISGTSAALAKPLPQQATPLPVQMSIGNDYCLGCHNNPNLTMNLANGDQLSLYVSPDVYGHSIHGQDKYACVQCHTTVGKYPHPAFKASDTRDVSLQLRVVCQRCHSSQFELTQDSVHETARANGNRNAAICTDCHTAHAVKQLNDPKTGQLTAEARLWIPQTCAKCHYAIYQKYSTSVHGSALLGQGNPDVPTCIDCHGVHNIGNPTTASFRLKSPELCAKCHTDPKIMDKYHISTQVLNTYVADFHGTTVTLFQKESPDQQTNKPVCFDCHGVHDIQRVDDPQKGLEIKDNLLARCKVCHPGASDNFPTAWLSHYIPSPDRHPLVFTVNTFYKFFIPGVLGGMAILVLLDMSTLVRKRLRRTQPLQKAGAVAYLTPEVSPTAQGAAGADSEAPPIEAAPPAPEVQKDEPEPAVDETGSSPVEPLTPPDEAAPGEPPEDSHNG